MFSAAPFQGMQLENSGIMLPKFCPDPSLASHHKHALSVTLGWVYDLSFPIDVGPWHKGKENLTNDPLGLNF
jgi:hypothetical protein